MDENSRTILVSSDNGIGAIVLANKAGATTHVPIDYNQPPPRQIEVPMAKFGKHLTGENPAIRVIDTHGLSKVVPLAELTPPKKSLEDKFE